MFSLVDITERLEQQLGESYIVGQVTELQPTLPKRNSLPVLYVGYAEERPAAPISPFNERASEGFAGFDEVTQEVILIQLITDMSNLIVHKTTVKDALLGWSPSPTNDEMSSFVSLGGAVVNINNSRVHWNHNFSITLPTM